MAAPGRFAARSCRSALAPANTGHDNRGGTYSPGNYAGGLSGAVILPVVWTVAGTPLSCTLISYVCMNAGALYKLTCTFGWTATNYNANTPTTYLMAASKVTDGTFDFTAANGNGNVTVGIGDLQLVSAQPQPVFWVTNP
jgi:hypothetical protein